MAQAADPMVGRIGLMVVPLAGKWPKIKVNKSKGKKKSHLKI